MIFKRAVATVVVLGALGTAGWTFAGSSETATPATEPLVELTDRAVVRSIAEPSGTGDDCPEKAGSRGGMSTGTDLPGGTTQPGPRQSGAAEAGSV